MCVCVCQDGEGGAVGGSDRKDILFWCRFCRCLGSLLSALCHEWMVIFDQTYKDTAFDGGKELIIFW